MSLTRGEEPVRVEEERIALLAAAGPAIVIAVAPTAAHRLRIADAVGDTAPVLLVSSIQEAMDLLSRDASVVVPEVEEMAAVTDLHGLPHSCEGLLIDSDARVAICGSRTVDLSPLEHDLLLSLIHADGHIRTFAWLQHHVWHNDHQGGRTHVQSVVKRLRRKLVSIASPVHIEAVRGVGLRLVGSDRPATSRP